jgi:cyclopropane-fatty-acyl-phospholipid synthase
MQFISIPEERYDEYRRSSDFIKEYIFPGGCLPTFSRITSAMSAASRLWYGTYIYNFLIARIFPRK